MDNNIKPLRNQISVYVSFSIVLFFIALAFILSQLPDNHILNRTVFEPPMLLPILNTIFLVFIFYLVAYLSIKSYLVSGASTLLYMGLGVLTLGTGSLAAAWLMRPYGPNVSVTVYNIAALVASMFNLAGTIMYALNRPAVADPVSRRRRSVLGGIGSVTFVLLLCVAAIKGITHPFFIQGVGPTAIRQSVLMISILLFVISATFLMAFFTETRTRFLYWYSLGLGMFALGLVVVYTVTSIGSLMNWIGRLSQYIAGVYFLSAAISALRLSRTQGARLTDTLADMFQRSERKISMIYRDMADAYYEIDDQWRFIVVNDRALGFFQKAREDLIGKSLFDVLKTKSDSVVAINLKKAMDEKIPVHFELQSVKFAGTWIDVDAYPMDNGLSVYFRDISERKLSEERLREAEHQKSLILDSTSDIIAYHDTENNLIWGNKAYLNALDLPLSQLKGKKCYHCWGLDRPCLNCPVTIAIQTGQPQEGELTPGNQPHWPAMQGSWYVRSAPVRDSNGKIIGAIEVAYDITEHKLIEEKLRESEKRFRAVQENTLDRFTILKPFCGEQGEIIDFTYLYQNAQAAKTTGHSPEDLIGRRMTEIFPTFPQTRFFSIYKQVAETGQAVEFEDHYNSDGVDEWFRAVVTPVPDGIAVATQIITERKLHETELAATTEELNTLINNAPVGIVYFDRELRYVRINDRLASLNGIPAAEHIGKTVREILPDLAQEVEDLTNNILATNKPVEHHEFSGFTPADPGQKHYWSESWYPLHDNDGNVIGFGVIVEDITERRRIETDLRKSEAKLLSLFQNSPDAIFLAIPGGPVTNANPAACAMFGMTEEELCRVGRAGIEDPSDPAPAAALEERARTGRVKYEATHVRKDGSKFPSEVNSAIVDEGSMSIVIIRDITERKLAEEKIRNSLEAVRRNEEQLLVLIENFRSAVALIDETGKFVLFNPAFLRIFGLSSESDILNINSQDWGQWKVYGEDGKLLDVDDHPVRKAAITGKPVTGQLVAVRNPGATELTWMLINAEPLLREDGTVYRLITTYSDITDRKQLEEELRKSRDELQDRVEEKTGQLLQAYESLQRETNERQKTEEQLRQSQKMEAIGTLAGGIAHDFNNILAGILGFTEMAIEDAEGQPQIERSLSNVLKSAKRGRDLVKQILSFSRKTNYEQKPLSVTPILKETIELLRASIPVTVEVKFSSTAKSDLVIASPTEVQQIVMNLATNAFMAMAKKGGTLEIILSDAFHPHSPDTETVEGEFLQLVVTDTGIGMTPEVLQKAFDPFFTTREPGKGTGMGLAVVYGIVTNLNGTITALSTPGEGSIFRMLLPKAQAAESIAEEKSTPELQGGNETILFVEDEELINEWGKTILEKLRYTVIAFRDPEEALQVFSLNPKSFNLLITDHSMPGMAGTELAAKILSLREDIPIILCTGHAELLSPEQTIAIGITEVLLKPLTKFEFATAVRRVLDSRKSFA